MIVPAPNNAGRIRVAELTSALGALALGIGLGVLLSRWLAGLGLWMLLGRAVAHAWGMSDKNHMEERCSRCFSPQG